MEEILKLEHILRISNKKNVVYVVCYLVRFNKYPYNLAEDINII